MIFNGISSLAAIKLSMTIHKKEVPIEPICENSDVCTHSNGRIQAHAQHTTTYHYHSNLKNIRSFVRSFVQFHSTTTCSIWIATACDDSPQTCENTFFHCSTPFRVAQQVYECFENRSTNIRTEKPKRWKNVIENKTSGFSWDKQSTYIQNGARPGNKQNNWNLMCRSLPIDGSI